MRLFVLLICLSAACTAVAQSPGTPLEVGIIDLYGLNRVSAQQVRQALTISVGEKIGMGDPPPPTLVKSERRLMLLPNVTAAHISRVCCDNGHIILFVGIQEHGAPTLKFRDPPTGTAELKPDVIEAAQRAQQAVITAIQHGHVAEDDSQGHALSKDDNDLRAAQERFVSYANRDTDNLRQVLRSSSNENQRAVAAQVLAYADNKQSVVDDLIYATTDSDSDVRNNAVRALGVMSSTVASPGHPAIHIPPGPFVAYLKSFTWTDRNKALFALMGLTAQRDPKLLAALHKQAMGPLVEMARWQSSGHAIPAFIILERIAGLSDAVGASAWGRGDRESVIKAAIAAHW